MDNRIRENRLAQDLTLDQLAQRAGTIASTIEKLEKGRRGLNIGWMRRIAKALGIAPADLLTDADNPRRLRSENEIALLDIFRQMDDKWQAKLLSRAWLMLRVQEGVVTEAEMEPNLPPLDEAGAPERHKGGNKPRTTLSSFEDAE